MPPLKIRHDVLGGNIGIVPSVRCRNTPPDELLVWNWMERNPTPPTGWGEREHRPNRGRPEVRSSQNSQSCRARDHVSVDGSRKTQSRQTRVTSRQLPATSFRLDPNPTAAISLLELVAGSS